MKQVQQRHIFGLKAARIAGTGIVQIAANHILGQGEHI
jgi:hypothetical protein